MKFFLTVNPKMFLRINFYLAIQILNNLKFINISPFHIGNKVRTNGDKYAALNPGPRRLRRTHPAAEGQRLLFIRVISSSCWAAWTERFFGGFKFEHDLVFRFSV